MAVILYPFILLRRAAQSSLLRSRQIFLKAMTIVCTVLFGSVGLLYIGSYFRACILSADGIKYSSYAVCGHGRFDAGHYFTGSLAFDRHQNWLVELAAIPKAWILPTSITHPIILQLRRGETDDEDTVWLFSIPIWLPLILLAILPGGRLFTWRRRCCREQEGCCLICGYDLRASPDRCPECGNYKNIIAEMS
jgi:hypothetical protein